MILRKLTRNLTSNGLVHEPDVWRAAERHHFCPIRSVHHDRRRVPPLHQVRRGRWLLCPCSCFFSSIGYSGECLGIHIGALHDANLGDGHGPKAEQFLARQAFPILGACWESLTGISPFSAVLQ
jgi:hypothetical protein